MLSLQRRLVERGALVTRRQARFRSDIVEAFSFFDSDGSGSIEYDELLQTFKAAPRSVHVRSTQALAASRVAMYVSCCGPPRPSAPSTSNAHLLV